MRESMARLTPRFSADRAVREYTEQHYLPAAIAYHSRIANKGAIAGPTGDWRHGLDQKWTSLRFGEVKIETHNGQHLFEVPLNFDEFDPKTVRVELYADGVMGGDSVCQEMKSLHQPAAASGGTIYSATVSAARPAADYTARVIPHRNGVAVPLEDARILWQR
jgi:starch phosphorylase